MTVNIIDWTTPPDSTLELYKLYLVSFDNWRIEVLMTTSIHNHNKFIHPKPYKPFGSDPDQQHYIHFMTQDMHKMKTTDYAFEREFRYKQSWMGNIKYSFGPQCIDYLDADWKDASSIVVLHVPNGVIPPMLTTYDTTFDIKIDVTSDFRVPNLFTDVSMRQYPLKNQRQIAPFPWNECTIEEPNFAKDVKIRREQVFDGKVPISFGQAPKVVQPCNYERVVSGFINEPVQDELSIIDDQVVVMMPLDEFQDGEQRLTMFLDSRQAIQRNLVATLLPYSACALQYSQLGHSNTDAESEFTVEDALEFEFSFRPAILRNTFSFDCENSWTIDSVRTLGSAGRLSSVFEVFESDITFWRDDDQDEVQIDVKAKIDTQWGLNDKYMFPIDLVLEFTILQSNVDMKELLQEQFILHLDLGCIFSISLLPDESSLIQDLNIQKQKSGQIEVYPLPRYDLNKENCPNLPMTQTVLVIGSTSPWLTQTECCLQISLDLYPFAYSVGDQTDNQTCHALQIMTSVSPHPELVPVTESTDFNLCIRNMRGTGPKFSASIDPVIYFNVGQKQEILLPSIESELPVDVILKVDDVEVPIGSCPATSSRQEDCPPIYLEYDDLNNQYRLVCLVPLLVRGQDSRRLEEQQQVVSAAGHRGLSFLVLVIIIDPFGRSQRLELILESEEDTNQMYDDMIAPKIDMESLLLSGNFSGFDEELPIIDELKAFYWDTNQKLNRKIKQKQRLPSIARTKKMNDEGLLTIKFEPEIEVTEDTARALKQEGLIRLKLVPSWDAIGWLEQNFFDFQWEVAYIDESQLVIQVDFAHPLKVSNYQENDLLLVIFHVTHPILMPKQPEVFDPIQKGFTVYFDVPPQKPKSQEIEANISSLLSEGTTESIEPLVYSSASLTGIQNIIAQHTVTFGLQFLWGMINAFQLVVHLPLYNVTIPANAMMLFNELHHVVSFDYFEKIYPDFARDMYITETKPFNIRFERLGYEERNIIANMGSIVVLMALILTKVLITVLVSLIRSCKRKKGEIVFNRHDHSRSCLRFCSRCQVHLWLTHQTNIDLTFRFMIETVFEILLCVIIGLGFQQAVEESDLNMQSTDKFSNWVTLFLLISMAAFLILVSHFTILKSKMLHLHAKKEAMFRYKVFVEKAMLFSIQLKKSTQKKEIEKIAKQRRSQKLTSIQYLNRKAMKYEQQKIKNSLRFYQTLFNGLYLVKPGSRFYHMIFVIRRSLLVIVIFILSDHVWLQFIIYLTSCLLEFTFLTHTTPVYGKLNSFVERFNEVWCMQISYQFLSLVGMAHMPEQIHYIGTFLIIQVGTMVVLNTFALFLTFFIGLRIQVRSCYRYSRARKQVEASIKSNKERWRYRLHKIPEFDSNQGNSSISIEIDSSDSSEVSPRIRSKDTKGFAVIDEEVSQLEKSSKSSVSASSDEFASVSQSRSGVVVSNNFEPSEEEIDSQIAGQEVVDQQFTDLLSPSPKKDEENFGLNNRLQSVQSDQLDTKRVNSLSNDKQSNGDGNEKTPRIWLPEQAFTNIQPKQPQKIILDSNESSIKIQLGLASLIRQNDEYTSQSESSVQKSGSIQRNQKKQTLPLEARLKQQSQRSIALTQSQRKEFDYTSQYGNISVRNLCEKKKKPFLLEESKSSSNFIVPSRGSIQKDGTILSKNRGALETPKIMIVPAAGALSHRQAERSDKSCLSSVHVIKDIRSQRDAAANSDQDKDIFDREFNLKAIQGFLNYRKGSYGSARNLQSYHQLSNFGNKQSSDRTHSFKSETRRGSHQISSSLAMVGDAILSGRKKSVLSHQ